MLKHDDTKSFVSLTSLSNYFEDLTKLFSDLYPAKFLNTLVKPFFLCGYITYMFYICNIIYIYVYIYILLSHAEPINSINVPNISNNDRIKYKY